MMFKGATILVITLCLVSVCEGKWNIGKTFKGLAKKAGKIAKGAIKIGSSIAEGGVLKNAVAGAASGAIKSLTGDYNLSQLQKMDCDDRQLIMDAAADELSSVFYPDALVDVMDQMDMTFRDGCRPPK